MKKITFSNGMSCTRSSHKAGKYRNFSSSAQSLMVVSLILILFKFLNASVISSAHGNVSKGLSSSTRFVKFGKSLPNLTISNQSEMQLLRKCSDLSGVKISPGNASTVPYLFKLMNNSCKLKQKTMI